MIHIQVEVTLNDLSLEVQRQTKDALLGPMASLYWVRLRLSLFTK